MASYTACVLEMTHYSQQHPLTYKEFTFTLLDQNIQLIKIVLKSIHFKFVQFLIFKYYNSKIYNGVFFKLKTLLQRSLKHVKFVEPCILLMYFWRILPAVTLEITLTCVDWYYYSTKQRKELSKKDLKSETGTKKIKTSIN